MIHGYAAEMSDAQARALARDPNVALVEPDQTMSADLHMNNFQTVPTGVDRIDAGCDCEAIVSGDALVLSIAAASIVAKVVRDRLMVRVGAAHPGYGFERHMGYSVPEHFAALARLGPTIHHRRSFAPVAAAYGDDDEPAASLFSPAAE